MGLSRQTVCNSIKLYQHLGKRVLAADKEQNGENVKNDIIKDYNSILRESALLASISGFLFGFLLNISVNTPKGFAAGDSIVLMIALFSITFAV